MIRRPFRARRLRRNRPPKALSLQDEAEAAWAEAEELQRRLSAEQEENRRQAIHLQQREAELHSADVELVALRRALAVLASADYEAVYTLLSPELDPDGLHLFRAAEIYTGCNVYRAFPVEDSLGYLEDTHQAQKLLTDHIAKGELGFKTSGHGFVERTQAEMDACNKNLVAQLIKVARALERL